MNQRLKAPVAQKRPHVHVKHGESRHDDYMWLRNVQDPKVLDHLRLENAHTEAWMEPYSGMKEQIYREMVARIKEDDTSAEIPFGPYRYFTRTIGGQQYAIHCRRPRAGGEEEVLLDPNEMAKSHAHFDLGSIAVSPEHGFLAYAVDVKGDETYEVCVKDLTSGQLLPDRLSGVSANVVWGKDSGSLYYTELDAQHRPYRLLVHSMGEDHSCDRLVFHEKDEAFFLTVDKTKDEKLITIHSESHSTTEVSFFALADENSAVQLIRKREANVEYDVWHHGGRWFMATNYEANNFRILVADTDKVDQTWAEWLPHRKEVYIEEMTLFQTHLVSLERVAGITQLWIRDLSSKAARQIQLPDPVYSLDFASNPEFESKSVRIHYSSPVTPDRIYEVDLRTGDMTIVKQKQVLAGFDASKYACKRLFARAEDGTSVPMTLIYSHQAKPSLRPVLLNGYGAYGINLEVAFNSVRISLLDRGVMVALAHVRGGSELGRHWYQDGKLENKHHSFSDFISCAELLIDDGYTDASQLIISGGSAGGLLMGTVVNKRPDLFRAVIMHVPFVDVLTTMLDETLPLTVIEYDEWGNPNDPTVYARIRNYSPYDQISAQRYPAMLVTAGLNDPRVGFWEPAKWVARLREQKTGQQPILLKTNLDAGHAGASGRYEYLKEIAFDYAFVFAMIGVEMTLDRPEKGEA